MESRPNFCGLTGLGISNISVSEKALTRRKCIRYLQEETQVSTCSETAESDLFISSCLVADVLSFVLQLILISHESMLSLVLPLLLFNHLLISDVLIGFVLKLFLSIVKVSDPGRIGLKAGPKTLNKKYCNSEASRERGD